MGGAILLLWIAIIALVVVFNIPWYYQTAIGRLPILIIGILCYKSIDNYKSGLVVFSLILIPVILLYLNGHINTYFLIYCIAPWIILILSYIIPMIKRVKSLNSIVGFMGEHSLELYVANVLISVYTKNLFHGSVTTLIYWSSHLLLIPLFCQLSAFYKKKLVV